MASVSVIPTPFNLTAMSTTSRRAPLSSNLNAANSPLRSLSRLGPHGSKRTRSYADVRREEAYGQPPPAKRQMIDHGLKRVSGSPTRLKTSRCQPQRSVPKAPAAPSQAQKSQATTSRGDEKDMEEFNAWQDHTRARFPKMVFYFESIPTEQRVKLAKAITQFGAREEKFFSIDITHVVTSRAIPILYPAQDDAHSAEVHEAAKPLKTIDPSLLNRTASSRMAVPSRKKPHLEELDRRTQSHVNDDGSRRPKAPRSADVLYRAQEMGKKIWTMEKIHKILQLLAADNPYGLSPGRHSQAGSHGKGSKQTDLLQLVRNEQKHGPSNRDPTGFTTELQYFQGPFIYVYDAEERVKPMMVREYTKVADKKDGDWPQFRVVSQGRCPFVEEAEAEKERLAEKQRLAKIQRHVDMERLVEMERNCTERAGKGVADVAAPDLKAPPMPPPRPVIGKRRLAEMEDGHNRSIATARPTESFAVTKVSNPAALAFQPQKAFTSQAKGPARTFAGEPVASGVQRSNVTSAIRSQMVSSTGGALGTKAGTSKEIHGLQRKVLQKASTPAVSQDLSSRRVVEMSHDSTSFVRSASLSRTSHQKRDCLDEESFGAQQDRIRRTVSTPAPKAHHSARDRKPGYCENCMDKFEDFDEHIASRKHRRFADNPDHWAQLDALLGQLKRTSRPT